MNKNNLRNRLSASVKNETESINKRFESADSIFLKNEKSKLTTASIVTDKTIKCTFSVPNETLDLMDIIIEKCARNGKIINKSELIRLSIDNFSKLPHGNLMLALEKLSRRKRGR